MTRLLIIAIPLGIAVWVLAFIGLVTVAGWLL